LDKEIWKSIKGYNGDYLISNKGNIISNKRARGRPIKSHNVGGGYRMVPLCENGNVKNKLVHRLVAKAFIPNPQNKPQINHIDSNPSNNDVNNLEWATQSENMIHSYKNGRQSRSGEQNHNSKLTEKEVLEIRNAYNIGVFLQKEIAHAFDISTSRVSEIVNRKSWTNI